MERQPQQPEGGEHNRRPEGAEDDGPEVQAHAERVRGQALAELNRLRDLTEQPDNNAALVEFARHVRTELGADTAPNYFEPAVVGRYLRPGVVYEDALLLAGFEHYVRQLAERETSTSEPHHAPRIYVADAASAERGIHHGLWLDANQTAGELEADVMALLDSSPIPEATRWAIYAMDGFAGIDLRGVTDVALIRTLARGVVEHGAAYGVWVNIQGTDDLELLDRFADFYVGSFDDAEAWMRDMADDMDWPRQRERITDPLFQPYVTLDYKAMAEDAAQSWDVATGTDGRFHVFMR